MNVVDSNARVWKGAIGMLVNHELAQLIFCHSIVNVACLVDEEMPCRPRQV